MDSVCVGGLNVPYGGNTRSFEEVSCKGGSDWRVQDDN